MPQSMQTRVPKRVAGIGTTLARRGWENFSLLTGGVGKAEPASSQRCTTTGIETAVTSCKMGILVKYKDVFFRREGNQILGKVVHRGCGNSGDIQSLTGLGLVQALNNMICVGPALGRK